MRALCPRTRFHISFRAVLLLFSSDHNKCASVRSITLPKNYRKNAVSPLNGSGFFQRFHRPDESPSSWISNYSTRSRIQSKQKRRTDKNDARSFSKQRPLKQRPMFSCSILISIRRLYCFSILLNFFSMFLSLINFRIDYWNAASITPQTV